MSRLSGEEKSWSSCALSDCYSTWLTSSSGLLEELEKKSADKDKSSWPYTSTLLIFKWCRGKVLEDCKKIVGDQRKVCRATC